jgi:hypothetical protein
MTAQGVSALAALATTLSPASSVPPPPEALAGFDNVTNGLTDQATFDADREVFDEQEFVGDGLGPTYNAQSCGECQQNPVSGGISQIAEVRAGSFNGGTFTEHPGGSLIHSRATEAALQERILPGNAVTTQRTSLNTLGDGYVECIADGTFGLISDSQARATGGRIRGLVIMVPVSEAEGQTRIGRFRTSTRAWCPSRPTPTSPRWGSRHRSCRTRTPPTDGRWTRTTRCRSRKMTEPTSRPSRGSCARPGRPRGTPRYYLLHDVGTGDGIVQNGGRATRNRLRTAPLWGLRTRNRLMHDGESLTFNEAVLRHAGEATLVTNTYRQLNNSQKKRLAWFLESL